MIRELREGLYCSQRAPLILAVQVAYGLQNEYKQIVVDLRCFSSASMWSNPMGCHGFNGFRVSIPSEFRLRPWLKRAKARNAAPIPAPRREIPDISACEERFFGGNGANGTLNRCESDTCYIILRILDPF